MNESVLCVREGGNGRARVSAGLLCQISVMIVSVHIAV